jgi:hypothetical protein
MKRNIVLEFSELHYKILIDLDDSQSPKTVRAIVDNLPIRLSINILLTAENHSPSFNPRAADAIERFLQLHSCCKVWLNAVKRLLVRIC